MERLLLPRSRMPYQSPASGTAARPSVSPATSSSLNEVKVMLPRSPTLGAPRLSPEAMRVPSTSSPVSGANFNDHVGLDSHARGLP